jgi:hypothetical protein
VGRQAFLFTKQNMLPPGIIALRSALPYCVLIALPFLVHALELSGWLSPNPLYLTAGLSPDWLSNGPIRGLPGWIDGNAGVTLQALGRLAVHDLRAGILPWWNPYSGVGMPLAGEMQPAAFFLPFVLLLGLDDGVLYLKITLQILSGLFTWGLMRQLGLRRGPALLGALLFELNGTFAWAADSPTLPIAFLPLLLWGIERAAAAARVGSRHGWAMIAMAIAYALLAGFPETAYIDGLLGLAWAMLRLVQGRGHRTGFALRVGFGGVVGLLLAAPLLVAFISFVQQSSGGRLLGHFPFPAGLLAQFLLPYAYGPIFFAGRADWYLLGGYFGVSVVALAISAIAGAAPRPQRALCWLLAGWLAACACKIANVPGVTGLWNAIPLIDQAMFFRYAVPSCAFCLILLASIAVDCICARRAPPRPPAPWLAPLAGCALCGLVCLAALWLGRPIWRPLGSVPGGRAWLFAAVAFAALCLATLSAAFARGAHGRWRFVVAALLLGEALINFTIPLLSGARGEAQSYDTALIAFLQTHLGFQRFFSLGPVAPNYGAYFGIASINHDYAPQPKAWIDFVHAKLDPYADATAFRGDTQAVPPYVDASAAAFTRRLPNYAELGVKYVLTRAPGGPTLPASVDFSGTIVAQALHPGQTLRGSFAPGDFPDGAITHATLQLGTYAGTSTGTIRLTLCESGACVSGEAGLDHVADNRPLTLRLKGTLAHHGNPILFEIAHLGGGTDVAVWLATLRKGGVSPASEVVSVPGRLPPIALRVQPSLGALPLVYEDPLANVFELPDPAPYARAAPPCALSLASREAMAAHCATPARLTRAELYFDGWHATVNGAPARITRDGLFQAVDLPAGDSRVEFWFWSPFETPAFVAAFIGCLMLAGRMFFFVKKNQKTFVPLSRARR